jgi:hypothetical protein
MEEAGTGTVVFVLAFEIEWLFCDDLILLSV